MDTKDTYTYDVTRSIAPRLQQLKTLIPELWHTDHQVKLTKLKGILQLSTVLAIGLSYWDDRGLRTEMEVAKANGYTLPKAKISSILTQRELGFTDSPESSLWVISKPVNEDTLVISDFVVYR